MAKIEQLPEEQRRLVGKELRKLIKKLKIKPTDDEAISALRKKLPKNLVPDDFEIKSLRRWVRDGARNLLTISKKKKGADPRSLKEYDVPGRTYTGKDAKIINQIRRNTQAFIDIVTGDPTEGGLAYDPVLVEKYFFDTDNQLRRLMAAVRNQNKKLPKNKRISFGHLNRLSESINSPRNVFLELLSENIGKGNRYMENPYAMLAIGNPTKEGLPSIKNWVRDFLFYADEKRHGGTGALPQRGDFGSLIERQIQNLTGNQWDKLDEAGKIDAINKVEDFLGEIEGRNQWTLDEKPLQRKWGILTKNQAAQALELSKEFRSGLPVKPWLTAVKQALPWEVGGALLDPAVHENLAEGNLKGAATESVKGAVIGGALHTALPTGVKTALGSGIPVLGYSAVRGVVNPYVKKATGKSLEQHAMDSPAGPESYVSSHIGGSGPNTVYAAKAFTRWLKELDIFGRASRVWNTR